MKRQVMERDQTEKTAVERPQRQRTPEPGRRRSGASRTLIIALILSVIGFAALAVVILNAGEEPVETTDLPDTWDTLDRDGGTPLGLGEGKRSAIVIIGAQDRVCWSGYIGSKAIEGCGKKQFDVSGAPSTLGVNARHKEPTRAFIGVATWNGDGNLRLDGDTSRKKFGLVSVTIYPPKPEK